MPSWSSSLTNPKMPGNCIPLLRVKIWVCQEDFPIFLEGHRKRLLKPPPSSISCQTSARWYCHTSSFLWLVWRWLPQVTAIIPWKLLYPIPMMPVDSQDKQMNTSSRGHFHFFQRNIKQNHNPNAQKCMDYLPTWTMKQMTTWTRGKWLGKYSLHGASGWG